MFKVGDKVKILSTATSVGVEHEDVGKVGVISGLNEYLTTWCGYKVQMQEICKARNYIPCWNIGTEMMEISLRKNQQLLFSFMEG